MNCPICGSEMDPGGIVTDGVTPAWVPEKEFKKTGLKRLVYHDAKRIGKANAILGQSKISNAYYCSKCNKIVGIFEVTGEADHLEAVAIRFR